jgi:predicted ATPase/class 3 adenylate cyclase
VAELPTGTVTFLFTDVEGSTRLLHELGDRYAEVLGEHRRALRGAFAAHAGVEVGTQGDAFFVAFARASDALAAAADACDALAGGPIRVRVGIHTGEPIVTDEGYVGIDVHRAARIAAAGHGGQILVSQSTRDLADSDGLRDLGEHRLKDLTAPERIYQLGDGDFPRLKSLNATNLPLVGTPLIGRERDVAEVADELGQSRLVTITGPGGIGKTRLALQVAAEVVGRFADGVFWVPLASLRDAATIPSVVAQGLNLHPDADVGEYVRPRSLLLVLDNAEHLAECGRVIAELLAKAEHARGLVTSRSPLHVTFEAEYALEPLSVSASVELFSARARKIRRDVELDESVAEICRRLDGLPLAVELAAARTKMLSPRAIRDRLDRRLPVLTGGPRDAPERQRTLAATIDWSYELLEDGAKEKFRHFAVFVGGADVAAAEIVCGAGLEDLASLVDESLLKAVGNDRFLMLETIREYAHDRLEAAGEAEELHEAHAQAYLALAERISPELWRTGQARWLELLESDRANLNAAFRWYLNQDQTVNAARLGSAVWQFWFLTGTATEGSRMLLPVLERETELPLPVRARVVYAAGHLYLPQGRLDDAERMLERALSLLRESSDAEQLAWAHLSLAWLKLERGDPAAASTMREHSLALFRDGDSVRGIAYALNDIAIAEAEGGDLDRARELFAESCRLAESLGDPYGTANATSGLADANLEKGELDEAERLYRSALVQCDAISSTHGFSEALDGLAATAAARGSAERAVTLAAAATAMLETAGLKRQTPYVRRMSRRLESAFSALDEERVRRAEQEVRSWTSEETVAYALGGGDG